MRLFLIIILLFLTLIWFYKSPYGIKGWLKNIFSCQGVIVLTFEILLILQALGIVKTNVTNLPLKNVFISIGLAIFLIGTILAVWAKLIMGTSWGRPAQHDLNLQSKLVTSGPFTYSRNPIYVGLFLLFSGFEMVLQSYLIVLIIPLVLIVFLAVKKEEKLLEKYFGKEYLEYKKRVPRFINSDMLDSVI